MYTEASEVISVRRGNTLWFEGTVNDLIRKLFWFKDLADELQEELRQVKEDRARLEKLVKASSAGD